MAALVDPKRHLCVRHLEPFRAEWPKGYLTFALALFGEFVRDPAVITFCTPSDGELADADRIPAALAHFAPICCHLGDETVALLTAPRAA